MAAAFSNRTACCGSASTRTAVVCAAIARKDIPKKAKPGAQVSMASRLFVVMMAIARLQGCCPCKCVCPPSYSPLLPPLQQPHLLRPHLDRDGRMSPQSPHQLPSPSSHIIFVLLVDIDECKTDNGGCFKSNSLLRQCVNTDGGRVCGDCPKGYTKKGEAGCSGQYG